MMNPLSIASDWLVSLYLCRVFYKTMNKSESKSDRRGMQAPQQLSVTIDIGTSLVKIHC